MPREDAATMARAGGDAAAHDHLIATLAANARTHGHEVAMRERDRGIWQDDAVWLPEIDATQKGMTLRRLMCEAVEAVLGGRSALRFQLRWMLPLMLLAAVVSFWLYRWSSPI